MNLLRPIAAALIAGAMLAACGDDAKKPQTPATTALAPASPASPTTAPAAPSTSKADPLSPRYEASLAQGIDFRKPGYPTFVAEVSGVSEHEAWGRWTDGPVARIRFAKPLPSSFTLSIDAGAIGPNFGKTIIVRAGKIEKQFTVDAQTGGPPPGLASFSVKFDGVSGDTIEIVPPSPVRPKEMDSQSTDTRALGVGLVALKIQG